MRRAIALGLVDWLVTVIVVRSEIARPLREYVARTWPGRPSYLVGCELCAGVWIGFALAWLRPGPLRNVVLDGLLYKAVGHLALLCADLVGAAIGAARRPPGAFTVELRVRPRGAVVVDRRTRPPLELPPDDDPGPCG